MDRRFVLRGKKTLSSELRPNEAAGWINEDAKEEGGGESFGGKQPAQKVRAEGVLRWREAGAAMV